MKSKIDKFVGYFVASLIAVGLCVLSIIGLIGGFAYLISYFDSGETQALLKSIAYLIMLAASTGIAVYFMEEN